MGERLLQQALMGLALLSCIALSVVASACKRAAERQPSHEGGHQTPPEARARYQLPLGIDVQLPSSLERVKGNEAIRIPPSRLEFTGRTMRIQIAASTHGEVAEPTADWQVETIRTSAGTGWLARKKIDAEGELPAGIRMVGVLKLSGQRTFTAQAWTTSEDDLRIVREIMVSVNESASRD